MTSNSFPTLVAIPSFMAPGGSGVSPLASDVAVPLGAGTLRRLHVAVTTISPLGVWLATVAVNGLPTPLSCVLFAPATSCEVVDLLNNVAILDGDQVSLAVTPGGGTVPAFVKWSLEFVAAP